MGIKGGNNKELSSTLSMTGNEVGMTCENFNLKALNPKSRQYKTITAAITTLVNFTLNFISISFEPFTKSIKLEIVRDSSKLQAGDEIIYFRLLTYFLSFHRIYYESLFVSHKTIGQGGTEKE